MPVCLEIIESHIFNVPSCRHDSRDHLGRYSLWIARRGDPPFGDFRDPLLFLTSYNRLLCGVLHLDHAHRYPYLRPAHQTCFVPCLYVYGATTASLLHPFNIGGSRIKESFGVLHDQTPLFIHTDDHVDPVIQAFMADRSFRIERVEHEDVCNLP